MSGNRINDEIPGTSRYVALLPAAGRASRLPGIQTSKELLPIGRGGQSRRPVIAHLLTSIRSAGVRHAIVVLRNGKWDIPGYLSTDEWSDMDFTYKVTAGTSGVPETVAIGLRDAGSRNVVFGFPDILYDPRDPFPAMIERLEERNADVVLGLFPTASPHKMDMVKVQDEGVVTRIDIKPEHTDLDLTWILAAWAPRFSRYLADMVENRSARLAELASGSGGTHLGQAFQLAMGDGLVIESVSFTEGRTLDIGTPDDLARAGDWV